MKFSGTVHCILGVGGLHMRIGVQWAFGASDLFFPPYTFICHLINFVEISPIIPVLHTKGMLVAMKARIQCVCVACCHSKNINTIRKNKSRESGVVIAQIYVAIPQ